MVLLMTIGYEPLYIRAMETGLVQQRQEFILPDDAYPILENAFVWRERIKRKKGCKLLGRLRRILTAQSLGNTVGAQLTYTFANIFASFLPAVGVNEPNKAIEPGTLVISIGAPDTATFTDNGNGTFTVTGIGVSSGSSINYATGAVTIVLSASIGGSAITANVNYFPNLPVMGLLTREQYSINDEEMVAFDTIYAYIFAAGGFHEFIPGTTWTGTDYNFFWGTNYWVSNSGNRKLFWVTNFSEITGDPIRYTDGITWKDFGPTAVPTTGQINSAGTIFLTQCLALLPFRSRLVAFNTYEGPNFAGSTHYPQRIRWAQIGNPITTDVVGPPAIPGAWRDDVQGKGGFLDIPTSEAIVSVGFVRDNLVIYCERSTWQLRYTGRSIAPFQIEKVNSELGAESTFSAIQFDTSLVGIGDKGVVECDSFKSERIDIKIPDLVFDFTNTAFGPQRVYGVRDFVQRLAYWTYPYQPGNGFSTTFPNRRLVYNYENDSWAIFTDSFTCFGTFQPPASRRWSDFIKFPADTWIEQDQPWLANPALIPQIAAGNQQGFVEILDQLGTNDETLFIENISGTPTTITSPNHNLVSGMIVQFFDIPTGTPYATELNNLVCLVEVLNANQFTLFTYSTQTQQFTDQVVITPGTYVGYGVIAIKDNFNITSKKFNYLEEGQNIQMGFIDILMNGTESGAISLNVFLDYNDNLPVNILPQNQNPSTSLPDSFFNSVVPTTSPNPSALPGTKYWQRVFCPVRGAFITITWTLSPSQMNGPEQEEDVQIDSQIIWRRRAGRQLPIGV